MSKNCHEMRKRRETEEAKLIVFDELEYNPENGLFRWKKTGGMRRRPSHWFMGRSSNGYKMIKIGTGLWPSHRLAWLIQTGNWPSGQIDHEDGKRANNVFTNLRDVPPSGNAKNKRITSANKSGVMGVHRVVRKDYPLSKPWVAFIKMNGKRKHLGYFETFEEAVAVRRSAEMEYGFHPNHGRKN